MWPDRVLNLGPLALVSDALLAALRHPACSEKVVMRRNMPKIDRL